MENRSENRYRSEIGLCARARTQRDTFRNRWNFDISISTLFPANNSFYRYVLLPSGMYELCEICFAGIRTYASNGTILTKQKFMDSVEFSSPFHRLVEHTRHRRRRGCCNSCNNLTSKPTVELQLAAYHARLRAFYRPVVQPYACGARYENVLHCLNARRER